MVDKRGVKDLWTLHMQSKRGPDLGSEVLLSMKIKLIYWHLGRLAFWVQGFWAASEQDIGIQESLFLDGKTSTAKSVIIPLEWRDEFAAKINYNWHPIHGW